MDRLGHSLSTRKMRETFHRTIVRRVSENVQTFFHSRYRKVDHRFMMPILSKWFKR